MLSRSNAVMGIREQRGIRFGKFHTIFAATPTAEKISDAAAVNRVTNCCPSVAVQVLWNFPTALWMCLPSEIPICNNQMIEAMCKGLSERGSGSTRSGSYLKGIVEAGANTFLGCL